MILTLKCDSCGLEGDGDLIDHDPDADDLCKKCINLKVLDNFKNELKREQNRQPIDNIKRLEALIKEWEEKCK